MQPDSPKTLEDIRDAADFALATTKDMAKDAYLGNRLVRQAIERNFEIIGEALNRLHRGDRATALRISDYRRIIAFRNIIAHGYDTVDHHVVWDILHQDLPPLLGAVEKLLEEAGPA